MTYFFIAKFKDGAILPVKEHDAIPLEDIQWLAEFMNDSDVPFVNALSLLCRKHLSFFYDPHPWVAGKLLININCQFVFQNLYSKSLIM